MNLDTLTSSDFSTTARAVLAFLHRRLGFALWMVTRVEGDDWIVLETEDHGYGVENGRVLRWTDSFCSEMVRGNGPRIAPDSRRVPIYAAAPIGAQVPIQAYIGVPLYRKDGSLFGTLCAIDPECQPDTVVAELELVELLAALLGRCLQAELQAAAEARRAERLQAEALTDVLTGLYNRRAWEQLLSAEEERCRRYGHPAAVIVADIDGLKRINDSQGHTAGDSLIARTAIALRGALRDGDIIARLGGDEFGILCVECDHRGAAALIRRLHQALAASNVRASVGYSVRVPPSGLSQAHERADGAMYQNKRSHTAATYRSA
jgi:diguanylate cyclase (GGDEF)-like protein